LLTISSDLRGAVRRRIDRPNSSFPPFGCGHLKGREMCRRKSGLAGYNERKSRKYCCVADRLASSFAHLDEGPGPAAALTRTWTPERLPQAILVAGPASACCARTRRGVQRRWLRGARAGLQSGLPGPARRTNAPCPAEEPDRPSGAGRSQQRRCGRGGIPPARLTMVGGDANAVRGGETIRSFLRTGTISTSPMLLFCDASSQRGLHLTAAPILWLGWEAATMWSPVAPGWSD
jgi:hypothetical protein